MRRFRVTFYFIHAEVSKTVFAIEERAAIAKAALTLPQFEGWTTLFGDPVDIGTIPIRVEIDDPSIKHITHPHLTDESPAR